jgi:uncharacterized NTF2-like protein DUF6841
MGFQEARFFKCGLSEPNWEAKMIDRLIYGVVIASCVVATVQGAQQVPGVPPAEVARIKADVTAAANEYMAKFSREDAMGIAENVYSHPAFTIRDGSVEATDQAKLAEGYANTLKRLKADGWVRSAFLNPKVCVLTANVALMSAKYARYDKDNKVILVGAETDVFAKTPQGWKLVALFGHGAEGGINCKE